MKKSYWILPLLFFTVSNLPIVCAQKYKNSALDIEVRVDDLLSKMTLQEKVAQLRIFHARLGIELNDSGKLELSEDVWHYQRMHPREGEGTRGEGGGRGGVVSMYGYV